MAILITGAGLVGSQIARLELERGEKPVLMDIAFQLPALSKIVDVNEVRLFQGDVLHPMTLARVIKEEKITRIIHTAANPLLTAGAQQNPYPAIQLNIMGTANVLEAARIFELERVVFCSSGVLYSYMEDTAEGFPRPSTIYASTKQACENLGLNYASFGVDFVAVRFSAVFGPWSGYGGGGGPSTMFRDMLEKVLSGQEAKLPVRSMEWVYSKDAAQGAFKACHAGKLQNRVFNISMGEKRPNEEIVSIIQRLVPGARVNLVEPPKSVGPLPKGEKEAYDISRPRAELGYEPQYRMEKAIEDFVEFLKAIRG